MVGSADHNYSVGIEILKFLGFFFLAPLSAQIRKPLSQRLDGAQPPDGPPTRHVWPLEISVTCLMHFTQSGSEFRISRPQDPRFALLPDALQR